jgi:hypothetical protein
MSRVPLAEFGQSALERNLNDLDWLGRVARTHNAVLERALASGPIVPLRLCTVFVDEDSIREMLDRERDVLLDALARLKDREEWGVKLMLDPQKFREAGMAGAQEHERPAGTAYLERKSRERRARADSRQIVDRAAQEVHDTLSRRAAAATLLRPQSQELSSRTGQMVLNGAYLVERARVKEFHEVASELGERQRSLGLELEVTGPWPPYNFVAPKG